MKITAEGRKSKDSNNKTIVNNVMGCLRALQGLSHLLAWTLIWTPPTWSGTYAEPTRYLLGDEKEEEVLTRVVNKQEWGNSKACVPTLRK